MTTDTDRPGCGFAIFATLRRGLLSSCALAVGLSAASAALAQVPPMTAAQQDTVASASRAAPAAEPAGSNSEEITVTARKRDERLVDVPAAISVVTAATLEKQRIENVNNLFDKVPGLYFSSNALSPGRDFVNLVIRGVGAQSAGTPAVGTFVDGVYTPALGFDTNFVDLERVEVLKGPQGTLFGRNTEGGALSIVTRKPTQQFSAKAQLGYDEFQTFTARASVSGGLTSNLAGSISVDYSNTNGYLEAKGVEQVRQAQSSKPVPYVAADDMRGIAVRGALRWQPDDLTDINLTGDISDRRGHEPFPGVPIGGLPDGRGNPFAAPNNKYAVFSDFLSDAHYKNRGVALTIDRDLGFAKLTSISGYRQLSSVAPFDFDGGTDYRNNYYDIRQKQRFLSEELRLAGELAGGSINWLAGFYVFDEHDDQYRATNLQTVPILTGLNIDRQDQLISRSGYAAFGQVSWKPIDRIEVTGGLRYSWEKASSDFAVHYVIPNLLGPGQDFVFADAANKRISFNNVSPLASVRFAVTPSTSLYARYAKGFKAGGFPTAPGDSTSDAPFKAETSDNYEIGIKGNIFGRLLGFDLSAFLININNQQLSTIILVNGNIPLAAVANAGKSRSKGFEGSFTLRPTHDLNLGASVGYTDARYLSYVDTAGVNRAGEAFPFTPKWTYSLSADYEHELADGWKGSLGASFSHVGSVLSGTGVDIDVQFPVPAYNKLDLRAGVHKGRWKFDVYADNVTNEYIVTRIFNSPFFPDPPARPFAIVSPPRRVGGRVTVTF